MTTKRTTKKAPAKAGQDKQRHPAFDSITDDRLNARMNKVFSWAMAQDHEKLAHMFADLWAVDVLTRRANRLHQAHASTNERLQMAREEIQRRAKRKGAQTRWRNDPAGQAMRAVRGEWDKWQTTTSSSFPSDAAFARAMVLKYPDITSEASIKNACSRWRKQQK